jgi:hypothetical protein
MIVHVRTEMFAMTNEKDFSYSSEDSGMALRSTIPRLAQQCLRTQSIAYPRRIVQSGTFRRTFHVCPSLRTEEKSNGGPTSEPLEGEVVPNKAVEQPSADAKKEVPPPPPKRQVDPKDHEIAKLKVGPTALHTLM